MDMKNYYLIRMLGDLDDRFKEEYLSIVDNIPNNIKDIIEKKRNVEAFNDKGSFVSVNQYIDEGAKQLSVEYTDHDSLVESLSINFVLLDENILDDLPVNEENKKNNKFPLIARVNYLIKDKGEYEYAFYLKKIDRENYKVLMNKNLLVDDRIQVKMREKIFEVKKKDKRIP